MGLEHLRNLLSVPGAQVTAVADPHRPSLDAARLTVGPEASLREFTDYTELLEAGCCDVVVVATPNMTHVDVVMDVLAYPLHVLVEKPLCTTVADCRRVLEAARGRPQVVWMGLEYRYMPPVARLVDEVRAGTVGEVHMVAIREHRYPFLEKIGEWNRFNANTGGTLVEKCCHFFDLMNLVIGRRPQRVLASGSQAVNHRDELIGGRAPDIIDNALVIVDYEGDVRASLDLCMFAEASRNEQEVSVVGDRGKVEAFLPSGIFRSGQRTQGPSGVQESVVHDTRIRHAGFHHGASYLEHLGLARSIATGTPPDVTLTDGLWSVAVGAAAHRSIDQGRPVSLDEVLEA